MKKVIRVAAIGVVAFLVLLPFLWTVSTSFKTLPEVNKYPPQWTSGDMSVMPYFDMFFYMPFATYTLNSMIVASAATIRNPPAGKLAAAGRVMVTPLVKE